MWWTMWLISGLISADLILLQCSLQPEVWRLQNYFKIKTEFLSDEKQTNGDLVIVFFVIQETTLHLCSCFMADEQRAVWEGFNAAHMKSMWPVKLQQSEAWSCCSASTNPPTSDRSDCSWNWPLDSLMILVKTCWFLQSSKTQRDSVYFNRNREKQQILTVHEQETDFKILWLELLLIFCSSISINQLMTEVIHQAKNIHK